MLADKAVKWDARTKNERPELAAGSDQRRRDGGKHQRVPSIVNFKANRSPVYSPRHKLLTTSPAISGPHLGNEVRLSSPPTVVQHAAHAAQ